jgi:3-oxoadipate enol-lactonase
MDFALEHAARAKALVMVGSYPSGLQIEAPDHPKGAEAAAAYAAGDLDLVAELDAQIWFDGMDRTPDQVDQAMRKLALDMNRIALANEAKHLGRHLPDSVTPAAERLAELHIPVLVVTGDHDIPYIQAAADYMLAHLPGAQRATIADAAHLPNMDHPAQFLETISAFLDQVAAQA